MSLATLVLASGPADEFGGGPWPRNLYEIDGAPLIEHVLGGQGVLGNEDSVVLLRRSEQARWRTGDVVGLLSPESAVCLVPDGCQGAAGSALWAKGLFDADAPLMVANGDIIIDANIAEIVQDGLLGADGVVVCFDSVHPRWSYVSVDEEGYVNRAKEKQPISRNATVGVYGFLRAGDFFDSIESMIKKDDRVNGIFYVCPSLNQMVLAGKRIKVVTVEREKYHSLASVAGVEDFVRGRESS